MKNIEYKTEEIQLYFSSNRNKWDDFYPSEKWVLSKLAQERGAFGDVLDVGCACGGLGAALNEKFIVGSYTGIDISGAAIDWACKHLALPVETKLIAGDFLEIDLAGREYDTVFSLSCADWNIETDKIIDLAWQRVKPGGYFIISLRLTDKTGVNDIKKSYQYINYSGQEKTPEIANYVVFNWKTFLDNMKKLVPSPEVIGAYGYWGKPSATAVTPYERLVFTVFYIKKSDNRSINDIRVELDMPLDILI
ncbi:MAG: class I SAM-dependent methyltransferase [Nanoarchaeota archaeon]